MSEFKKSVEFSLAKGEAHTIVAVAYAPMGSSRKDSQGEYVDSVETIEQAAASYMENGAVLRLMHGERLDPDRAHVVESHVAHEPTTIGGKRVPRGALILKIRIDDESLWQEIRDGRWKSLSIGGRAQRDEDGRLERIDLQEVSIVDRGAFQGADFLVAKRDEDGLSPELAQRILDFCGRAEREIEMHKLEERNRAFNETTIRNANGETWTADELAIEERRIREHNAEVTDRLFGRQQQKGSP